MSFQKPVRGAMERRTSFVMEVRASGDKYVLEGRAASYNVLSQDLGGFREILAPGCFSRSVASDTDIKCLFNHDPSKILGRRKNGTLTVTADDAGLSYRCQLNPKAPTHRDVYEAIKRGDVNECSFAFDVPDGDDDWTEDKDDRGVRFTKRTIRNLNLWDVSCVTQPAYNAPGATTVSARSLPHYGAADYLRYVQKRAKQLGILISMDATTQRQYELIDALNRADAARIAKQIESDLCAVQRAERQREADKELERKMQLLNGRLRK